MDLPEDYDLQSLRKSLNRTTQMMKDKRTQVKYKCKMCTKQSLQTDLWKGYCNNCWERKEKQQTYWDRSK